MSQNNLSEILFKPRMITCAETSTLIRRANAVSSKPGGHWYRLLDRLAWIWRGVSPQEILEVQSRIVISDAPRSNPQLYDTVTGYRNGNWIYEWSQQAMRWQQRATQDTQPDQCMHHWRKAASLYSIAAYPYLQGDELAAQALSLANRAYEQAIPLTGYAIKPLTFTPQPGKPINAYLSLPATGSPPYATVLMCGELDALHSDYQRFFEHYLAPRGIAMLSTDMPAVGHAARYKLGQDASMLHQHVLQSMDNIPWIDQRRIGIFGFRFGANIAVRLAYLQAPRLQAVACLSPIVHQLFHDPALQSRLPGMYLDVLASRLGMTRTTDSTLRSALSQFSLKTQGLLGRNCPTPMLACFWQNDPFSPPQDAWLIANSSATGKLLEMSFNPVYQSFDRSLNSIADWLQQTL